MSTISLREIKKTDNQAIKEIIIKVMTEFGCSGEGFSLHDEEVQDMFKAYQSSDHLYMVIEKESQVFGGGGIGALTGETTICELKKMYFLPELRGSGAANNLMHVLLEFAAQHYKAVYIETTRQMIQAQRVYSRHGFEEIPKALGSTGHFGCDRFYLKTL